MKLPILYLFAILLLVAILPARAETETVRDMSTRILIVDGFSNHDWRATTGAIQSMLAKLERVEVEISTVPEESEACKDWLPDFGSYDVVIQNTNDINNGRSWPEPAKSAFEKYMIQGGAMLVFHSANNAFPNWPEYNKMIGLGWRKKNFGSAIVIEDGKTVMVPKGEGGNTGHGKRVDARVTRMGEHAIHKGLPKSWLAADMEVYRYARGPAGNLEVLSYAGDAETGKNFPVEWVVTYGKGRVYNSTYGHYWHDLNEDPPGMRCMAFQTLFGRAVMWLAGRKIDPTLPRGFPDGNQVSLEKD